jgi:cell wall-associated NlpC family hydrolase
MLEPVGPVWPVINPEDRRMALPAGLDAGGRGAGIGVHIADMKAKPENNSELDTQILYGEAVTAFDTEGEWTRIKARRDGYVGWTRTVNISPAMPSPDYRVIVPRTFVYPEPDMKRPRSDFLSMGSLLQVEDVTETRGTQYAILSDGRSVVCRHIAPMENNASDFVAVAESFLRTPYLWGGCSGFGLDCSGLVQLAMRMAGINVMRDTDMQAATIGDPVDPGTNWCDLERGDLVFWKGHVAIAQGEIDGVPHLIHANGYTMDVTSEPASQAIERIASLWQRPIGVRRP